MEEQEARRPVPADRRPARRRRHDLADPVPRRVAPLQRGRARGRLRARRHGARRDRLGLAAGDQRAGLRAQRPRPVAVDVHRAARVPARGAARRLRRGGDDHQALRRAVLGDPADVAVGRPGLDAGQAPAIEAALVKEVGTRFEQDLVEALRVAAETELDQGRSLFGELLAEAVLTSPKYTLQGGTTEILRSVAAKAQGASRSGGWSSAANAVGERERGRDDRAMLVEVATGLFRDRCTPRTSSPRRTGWATGCGRRWSSPASRTCRCPRRPAGRRRHRRRVRAAHRGRAVRRAGAGGDRAAGRLAAGRGRSRAAGGPAVGGGRPGDVVELSGGPGSWKLTARVQRVPWGGRSERVALFATVGGDHHVVSAPVASAEVTAGHNLAVEPRDTLTWDDAALPDDAVGVAPAEGGRLRAAAARSAEPGGADLRRAGAGGELTVRYTGSGTSSAARSPGSRQCRLIS